MISERIQGGLGPLRRALRNAGSSAVGTYAAYVIHGLFHPKLLRANATDEEARAALPGDFMISDPHWQTTFATTVNARPEDIWPWLLQMGYGRAGWYTWYRLDNGGVASAERILHELQDLRVGDVIPDGPRASEGLGIWRVAALEPCRLLLLHSRRVPTTGLEIAADEVPKTPFLNCTWAFVLTSVGPATTRLLVRVRARIEGVARGRLAARLVRLFFGVGDTVWEHTMLDGIRARAERSMNPRA